jgi:hypothetical protein
MIENSTKLQDCNMIAQAFERGAAHNTDEASVIAMSTRHVQNTKILSQMVQKSLSTYQHQSSLPLDKTTGNPADDSLSGMKIQGQYIAIPTNQSSSILARAVKECVPCGSRVIHNIDLNVSGQLIKALKDDFNFRFKTLDDLKNLLSNIDIYGDFCQMASFLNFMCIPDLQRMIVVLMAMLTDFSVNMLSVNGLLQALLAPFFTPVLMGINSLLDQLVQLVLSPLTCIITSIEQNITKLDVGALVGDTTLTSAKRNIDVKTQQTVLDIKQFQGGIRSGLMELHTMLNQGDALIRSKLNFYTQELSKFLGQWGAFDSRSVALSNRKIISIRLIGLIQAMIKAKGIGAKLCNESQKPTNTELDNFFGTFVSPNSPFNISVDGDGNLNISPKLTTSKSTKNIQSKPLLTPPANVRIIKCAINTTAEDVSRVNKWISELNQS